MPGAPVRGVRIWFPGCHYTMDFFERQETARRHTKVFVVYFVLAVIGIIAAVYLAVDLIFAGNALKHHSTATLPEILWNPKLLLGVAVGTVAIIFCGSSYKTLQLSSGGSSVAEMLGGRPVDANTTDPDERKLLNVVEEMAIASGTPVPQVYVLREERGINAFAAGHSTKDMAVCVTGGAMRSLTRDELQGVIGHEFSHILNGDMRLNLRLMGLVFGILCLAILGRILLETRSNRSKDRNPLPLLGLALLAIGGIGVFFGKLIKSAVSRQREFLADAAAVQFTRNPAGLASALKKVGGSGSRIMDPNAEDASHLFFANGLTESFSDLFSTHPPLSERIRALDPSFDGKFTPVRIELPEDEVLAAVTPARVIDALGLGDLLGRTTAAAALSGAGVQINRSLPQVGTMTAQHLDYAADLRSKLPPALTEAARDPMSAVALIYAMLLSPEEVLRTRQLTRLQTQVDPGIYQETARLAPATAGLESRARLPLAALTLTALRRLSPSQYLQFKQNLKFIIESDQQIELFEYTLQKMVLRQLDPNFSPPQKQVVQFYVLKPLIPECAVLLSALAYAGQVDPEEIERAFETGAQQLGMADLSLLDAGACGLNRVDAALNRLNQGAPHLKKLVLGACAATVAADGVIQEHEAELLRAVADMLDCPIPPFLTI
jgi:Zn-dependent protease with chaperone function